MDMLRASKAASQASQSGRSNDIGTEDGGSLKGVAVAACCGEGRGGEPPAEAVAACCGAGRGGEAPDEAKGGEAPGEAKGGEAAISMWSQPGSF